jgi:hypothetical protein
LAPQGINRPIEDQVDGTGHRERSNDTQTVHTSVRLPANLAASHLARRSDSDQSDGSWQCYPYCQGGTYEGRPVREWMKPDGW